MNTKNYLNNLLQQFTKLMVLGLCVVSFVSGWLVSGINNQAQAGIFDSNSTYQEDRVYEKVDSDIVENNKTDLEKTSNKLQQKVERDIDSTKKTLDKAGNEIQKNYNRATNQTEGYRNQLEGSAQENIGKTQTAANKATNSIQDAAEGAIDAVKDIFKK